MRIHGKLAIAGAMLVLTSGTALAHGDVRFGLSIGLPVAPVYVAPPPEYYEAPPATYDVAPPQVYYAPPPPAYYESAPGESIYYRPSHRHFRERRDWHRERDRRDDDDD